MTDFDKIEKSAARRQKTVKAVTYILLTLWALMVLFPFYWMLLSSVKSYSAYNSEYIPQLFTLSPTLQNYVDVRSLNQILGMMKWKVEEFGMRLILKGIRI